MSQRVSVCIANYNGELVIRRCLDAVLAQHCDCDVEIIVHDDASTDASVEILATEYAQVTLVESESNIGFCRSNNRMVEYASGDILLFLNNDTRLHAGALQALWEHSLASPGAAVLTLPQYAMESGELLDRGLNMDIFANPVPNLGDKQQVASVMGSCLWLRRETWDQVGGFPQWFESMAEDLYLCTAARLAGHSVEVTAGSGYDHVVGHSFGGGKVVSAGLSTSYRRRRLSELNKGRVMALCYPAPLHFVVLAVHCLLLIAEGAVLSLLKLSARPMREIYWPAVSGLVMDWSRLKPERQICQRLRAVSIRQFFHPVSPWPHKLTLLMRHGVPRIS